MVIIGGRKDVNTGEYFFLIQNFWQKKPFLEVSANYLDICSANSFRFIHPELVTSLVSTITDDQMNDYEIAECVDGGDCEIEWKPSDDLIA